MAQFTTPINDRYLDDYPVGETYEFDPIDVDEREVIAFAEKYDPQYVHIDPEAALQGPFGGLIASGWNTIALLMRVYVLNFLSANAAIASPGVDELRWLQPVRPGDSLRLRVTVVDKRVSRSKPDRGLLFTLLEGFNQRGELAVSFKAMNMLRVRPSA